MAASRALVAWRRPEGAGGPHGGAPMDVDRLISRAKMGDAAAFNRLVDVFGGLAHHVALQHLAGNVDDAQDACQEAMLSAWRGVGNFEGDGRAFRGWLMRIVINACRDRLRYEGRRPHHGLEGDSGGEAWAVPLPDPGLSPEEYAANADLGALLAEALTKLSDEHREIILLDQAGFRYAEIAAILGVEGGTVKSRLSRARQQMRALLTSGAGEPTGGGGRLTGGKMRRAPAPGDPDTRSPRARRP